jgi:putative tricarboxylic transport membrane protein
MRYLIPSVLVVALFGSYAINGTSSGPITLAVFSVIGWGMVRYNYPVAATVVGLILGSLVEGNLLRTYQISGGELSYALERPGALFILALIVVSFGLSAFAKIRRKRKEGVPMGAS